MEPRPRSQPVVALDLVRGLAALAVVVYHVRFYALTPYQALAPDQRGPLTTAIYAVTQLGHEGVLIFFVLSGYLVMGPILAAKRPFRLGVYAIDRSSRIFLPLIPACLLTGLVAILAGEAGRAAAEVAQHGFTWPKLVAHMVGLNGVVTSQIEFNLPLWTIAYEIWFYVLGAAIALFVARKRPLLALTLAVVGVMIFAKLSAHFLLCWMLGGAMVFLKDHPKRGWLAASGVPLMVLGSLFYQMSKGAMGMATPVPEAVGEATLAAGMALLLPWLTGAGLNRRIIWIAPLAAGLSAISYSLYLVHYPLIHLGLIARPPVHGGLGQSLVELAVRVGLCVLGAIFFWWLFESRTGALRRALRRRFLKDDGKVGPAVEPTPAG